MGGFVIGLFLQIQIFWLAVVCGIVYIAFISYGMGISASRRAWERTPPAERL